MSDEATKKIDFQLQLIQNQLKKNIQQEMNKNKSLNYLEKETREMQKKSIEFNKESKKVKFKMKKFYWIMIGIGIFFLSVLFIFFFKR